jgi:predicted dehydrogenase
MKVLIVGLGSIGQRHLRNLLALYPDTEIVACDPIEDRAAAALAECSNGKSMAFEMLGDALAQAADAQAVIIASPDGLHAEHMSAVLASTDRLLPIYLEKPICDLADQALTTFHEILDLDHKMGLTCAVGYQYRWHPVARENYARWQAQGNLKFFARDDLEARYGRNCLSVMAAHPIDTALYVLGPAERVRLKTNGLSVSGRIWHHGGGLSEFDIAMQAGNRLSKVITVDGGGFIHTYDLRPDEGMYRSALKAWLDWAGGGDRLPQTATLAEGWQSIEVMQQVKQI